VTNDCAITLISEISDGVEERKELLATVESVGQREFFAAAQAGFKAECKVSVWQSEYEGQEYVELILHGRKRRLFIYRVFDRDDEKTELYLTNKVGVIGGN